MLAVVSAMLLAGCQKAGPTTEPAAGLEIDGVSPELASQPSGEVTDDSGIIALERVTGVEAPDIDLNKAAAAPAVAAGVSALKVDVWVMSVPWGTVSSNEAFWKRMDETVVDVATYDLLYRNGMRVGGAPVEDWGYFKELLAKHPAAVQQTQLTTREEKTFELEVRKKVDGQTIFVVDANNSPVGRTYDLSDNLMVVGFRRSLARADAARVVVCPVVRSERKRLEVINSGGDKQAEIAYTKPEHLYEMNLVAEVPFDRFLVIAPSRDIRHPTNLGRNFLVEETPTERLEKVIVIVPSLGEVAGDKPRSTEKSKVSGKQPAGRR